jgi:hypothetical protein
MSALSMSSHLELLLNVRRHLRVVLGELRVVLGELRVVLGELRVVLGELRVVLGELRVVLGELRVVLGEFVLSALRVTWRTTYGLRMLGPC